MEKNTPPVYELGYAHNPLRLVAQAGRFRVDGFLTYKLIGDKFVPICRVHQSEKLVIGEEPEDEVKSEDVLNAFYKHAHEVLPKGMRYKTPDSEKLQMILNIGRENSPRYILMPTLDAEGEWEPKKNN